MLWLKAAPRPCHFGFEANIKTRSLRPPRRLWLQGRRRHGGDSVAGLVEAWTLWLTRRTRPGNHGPARIVEPRVLWLESRQLSAGTRFFETGTLWLTRRTRPGNHGPARIVEP